MVLMRCLLTKQAKLDFKPYLQPAPSHAGTTDCQQHFLQNALFSRLLTLRISSSHTGTQSSQRHSLPTRNKSLTRIQTPGACLLSYSNSKLDVSLALVSNQSKIWTVLCRNYHSLCQCSLRLQPKPSGVGSKWTALPVLTTRQKYQESSLSEVFSCTHSTMATPVKAATPPASTSVTTPAPGDLQARQHLREIFSKAVHAGLPKHMLEKVLNFNPKALTLTVEDRSYKVDRNVFVVGFGKAVLGMARVVDDVLGPHIIKGILSIPKGCRADLAKAGLNDMMLAEGSNISIQEGAENNLPDVSAFHAARDIHKLISNLTEKDIVIVLMSGGGSALLPYPVEPLTMDDVLDVTRVLFSHGANITEVNTVRKHLELLKGGGLAKAAMPAQVIAFIISDVIGDSLDMIASGPTVRHTYSPHRCLEVIDRVGARTDMPEKVLMFLEAKKTQVAQQAALALPDPIGTMVAAASVEKTDWSRIQNVLVGTNAIACRAAASHAQSLGYETLILSTDLSGEAPKVGRSLAKLARYISVLFSPKKAQMAQPDLIKLEMELVKEGISKTKLNEVSKTVTKAVNFSRPLCLIAGGETVVHVRGEGKGGRNQEMVLAAAVQMHDSFSIKERGSKSYVFFFSAGTDGQDGPTDAAGAVVDEHLVLDAQGQGIDPGVFLENNDSYRFWKQFCEGRDLVITGMTGTNVMDIQLLLVKDRPRGLSGR